MALLPILTGENNPVLRTKTKKVPKMTKELVKVLQDMIDTTIGAKGAGIAAPQVNRSERICIALIGGVLTPLVNPEITWRSEEIDVLEEGCLSLPSVWLPVPRSTSIVLAYKTQEWKDMERKLQAFDARVVQHEVDHLEGKLIVDYRITQPATSGR